MKRALIVILVFALLFALTCCNTNETESSMSLKKGDKVFDTEGITKITVYQPASSKLIIPEEYFEDMINWLDTFTVGDKADIPLAPGTNTFEIEIEYSDNKIVSNGLDTIKIGKTIYDIDHTAQPDWWYNMLDSQS